MAKHNTLELKLKAIAMYNGCGNLTKVAEQLNISIRTLSLWRSTYHKGSFIPYQQIINGKKDVALKKLFKEFKKLQKENEEMRLEREILKMGGPYLLLRPQGKYPFIKQYKSIFPLIKMCRIMKIGHVGYYRWLTRLPTKQSEYNKILLVEIKRVYVEHKGRYGSNRIAIELKQAGFKTNQASVCTMMRGAGLKVVGNKRYKITTNSSHKYPVVENRLLQKFEVTGPNEVWVSDMTYIRVGHQSWQYLTTIIDLFDRKVIGWSLSGTMKAKDTTLEAFRLALLNRPLQESDSLIFHSDRGIQYACKEFTSAIKKNNILQSMSRKGNFWDNAVAESFFGTLKLELINENKYETKEQVQESVFEYIENYYNTNRRHSALNNLTMIEFQKLVDGNLKNNYYSEDLLPKL